MIYNSFNFIVFFPIIFLGYYLIPGRFHRVRNLYLLLVSYLIYLNWIPAYALILLGVTLVTYAGAYVIEKKKISTGGGKILFVASLIFAILPLLIFKYYNFLNATIRDGLATIGMDWQLQGLNWAIPLGISFFTFQAVGYMADVYENRVKAEKNFIDYALFISFFPSIVSGPINKASLLLPQIKEERHYFDYQKAVAGLKMLLWGMFMKVVVADRVALYVDTVLPHYENYTGVTCFLASIFYSIQIYADFAGYSLMAIGVGKTLGFDLTENFRRPYFSQSITEFWRRWHISLSTWLKDYIYIPLGGSRCSKLRNYWNIFVTFLVSGIWHGANWTFIAWGVMHGICQIVEKALGLQKGAEKSGLKAIRIGITFLVANFAWIFFRMPTLSEGLGVITRIFDWTLPKGIFVGSMTDMAFIAMGILIIFIKDYTDEFMPGRFLALDNSNRIIRWCSYIVIMSLILLTGVFSADQFIYANF